MYSAVRLGSFGLLVVLGVGTAARGELPNPVLNTVFPPGGRSGSTFELTVSGSALQGCTSLWCSCSEIRFEQLDKDRFSVTIPAETSPGLYDLRAVCAAGLSSPRSFFVGNRDEQLETDENNPVDGSQLIGLDVSINGRIDKKGDIDSYRFVAQRGQRVVIECWAERIDSRLRCILELYDERGRRLKVSRGYRGLDPLILFEVPADGSYLVKLFDLTYSGGSSYFYRLDIDTGPRVVFTVPAVIEQGQTSRVTLYGWNLARQDQAQLGASAGSRPIPSDDPDVPVLSGARRLLPEGTFERIEVEITPPAANSSTDLPLRLRPEQIGVDGFAYRLPGAHAPVLLGLADIPVVQDHAENHSPASAQTIRIPCEVSGQLISGDEQDWFAIDAKRGEVLWFQAFGQRIGSPVDLDVSVLDPTGLKELARFSDELLNPAGTRFPSNHLDPAGRWVVPLDGRYLIVIRSLIGGLTNDPSRVYRLNVRREDSDFQLAAISPHQNGPAGFNVWRGGRTMVEVFAFRRRGQTGSIRIAAEDLPPGIECPDVWIGPGVNSTPLILTARNNAPPFAGSLKLVGISANGLTTTTRRVRGGTDLGSGLPNGAARMTATVPLGVAGEAPVRMTATGSESKVPQGSVINVAVDVSRRDLGHNAPVNLIGVGFPESVRYQTTVIPAGQNKGYVSFALSSTLSPGRYTIAVRGQTTAPFPVGAQATTLWLVSNPVSFDVYPAPFLLSVDRNAPRKVKRGEFIRLDYYGKRKNGFIGKIHTVLGAPGGVVGIRARGVTFVGQTEKGTLQIIASDDAPLGRLPSLYLEAVGTVEDESIYQARCFVELEVVP